MLKINLPPVAIESADSRFDSVGRKLTKSRFSGHCSIDNQRKKRIAEKEIPEKYF